MSFYNTSKKTGRHSSNPFWTEHTANLGIPTVVDRVVQQAIAQVLTPIYEKQFSESSFGFRPKRSAHNAIQMSQNNIAQGYRHVVDMDLEKYFDTVNQSKLIEVLSRTIKDGRVISLIHKYLKAGVVVKTTEIIWNWGTEGMGIRKHKKELLENLQ
jgi:retron-type reverse transcriptase